MQTYLRKYGVQTIINFVLYEIDGVDFRVDAADGGTDCTLRKDQGADTTCDNDFVDEGMGYSLTLTATEMEAAELHVYIVDSATKQWLDEVLKIETYGNASAQHALDLDSATVTLADGGLTAAKIGADAITAAKIADDAISAEHLNTGALTADAFAADAIVAATLATGAISADAFAADAIVAATLATDAIAADGLAADAAVQIAAAIWDRVLTGATHNIATSAGRRLRSLEDPVAGTVDDAGASTTVFITDLAETTDDHYNDQVVYFTDGALQGQLRPILDYDGGTKTLTVDEGFTEAPGNGDAFDILPQHVHPIGQITGGTWEEAKAGHTTAGSFGEEVGVDTPTDIAALPTNAEVNAEVLDVMNVDTFAEPGQGTPGSTLSIFGKIGYLMKNWRNAKKSTATQESLLNDDAVTVDQKSALSDDGTTFKKGEVATGP